MANNNNLEVQKSKVAMAKMKMEVAQELGMPDYDKMDKGSLPARVHGYVGGNMVRKMIKGYETALANGGTLPATTTVDAQDKQSTSEDKQRVTESLSMAPPQGQNLQ